MNFVLILAIFLQLKTAVTEEVMNNRSLYCYFTGSCPDSIANCTCKTKPGGSCFSAVEQVSYTRPGIYEIEKSHGCMPPDEYGLRCEDSTLIILRLKNIYCCDSGNFCNHNLLPVFTNDNPHSKAVPIIILCYFMLFIILILSICQRIEKLNRPSELLSQMIEQSSSSGSGLPLLDQRTIAKQIRMECLVGSGRYGEVWLATWRNERVAVKTFFTAAGASWFRETEIYQKVLIRHENILGFIAADIQRNGCLTKMLLITEYHKNGSLHDYLSISVINPQKLQLLAYSLISGLAHLHEEILGTPGKPAVAHRNISSRNILVKRNGQCTIADFGLVVKYISETDEMHIAHNTRVGTKRYMAPEVLNQTLNPQEFEEFKRADMYSVGLVFWETARRCYTSALESNDYAMPYHDVVPSDPSIEDMHAVVCVKGIRPPILSRWRENEVLETLAKVMQGCWHPNPSVRLTALHVKNTLGRLKVNNTDCVIQIV